MASEPVSLKDKVIAVTGASRGLGAVFARRLSEEGAQVVLLARPSDDLDKVGQSLPGSFTAHCDISDPDNVRSAFSRIQDKFGGLDVLVNNAAMDMPNPVEDATDKDIFAEVNTNLIGPILCIRSAIPLLKKMNGGDIINISSISVKQYTPYLSIYTATKGGLEALSSSLREELRHDNIRVAVLRAGGVAGTSLSAKWLPEHKQKYYEVLRSSGALSYIGGMVQASTFADTLVHLLKMPREAASDIVEVRGI